MNMNDLDHWDIGRLRAAAARERAQALRDLRARFAAWLRTVVSANAPQAKARECVDAGR